MKITALAPWFGGKRTLAPDIAVELGSHTQYFELFCGSMAVLFAKQPSQKETATDLHGDLINLAWVLQNESLAVRLYLRLDRTLMTDGILDEAREVLEQVEPSVLAGNANADANPEARLDRAYWYFVASWMGRNGTAGTDRIDYQLAVRWTVSGGSPTVRFVNAVDSIPGWHRRLRNVVVLRRDAFQIVDRLEDIEETAIYADPPYAEETRSNLGDGGGSGGKYLHEFKHTGSPMFGEHDDHERLALALRKYTRARIVVSAYDCPRYRELYKGWRFVEKTRQKNLHAQNGRGQRAKDAPEILIVNGPAFPA